MGLADLEGFHPRFKAFDYGVLSVALTRALPGTWEELLNEGLRWQDDPQLDAGAERLCRELLSRIGLAVTRPRHRFLTEDYLVSTIDAGAAGQTADALLASRGALIAQLLRGDREALSAQEREEVLRHRISYSNDVVIATWSSSLVYDTRVGAQGVLEILEFANAQLLDPDPAGNRSIDVLTEEQAVTTVPDRECNQSGSAPDGASSISSKLTSCRAHERSGSNAGS
jgi:hypothetical protein